MVLAQKQTYGSMEQNREPRDKPTHQWTINLPQRRQEYTMGKKTVSSASGVGKAGQLHVNQWSENTPLHHIQTQTKNDLKMNIRLDTKTPKREQRQNILWHKSYRCFLRSVSQSNRNISKNQNGGSNQTYKLLHSKETINKMERQSLDLEKTFAN